MYEVYVWKLSKCNSLRSMQTVSIFVCRCCYVIIAAMLHCAVVIVLHLHLCNFAQLIYWLCMWMLVFWKRLNGWMATTVAAAAADGDDDDGIDCYPFLLINENI